MIAQFTAPEALSYDYFAPLVVMGLVYAVLFIASSVVAGRGNVRVAEQLQNLAFVLMLAGGVYTLVLAIYAISERSELMWDAIRIFGVVAGFFLLLAAAMLLVELLVGRLGRSRAGRRRTRATAQPSEGPAE